MKKHVTITIDESLHEKAVANFSNFSGIIENLLLEKLSENVSPEMQAMQEHEEREAERYEELKAMCREFWQSPFGVEIIKKAREHAE